MGSIFSHLLFTCWRGKSYIAMQEISVIEIWAIYVDWSFSCCCCFYYYCCYCVLLFCSSVITDEQQQNYTVTTTTMKIKTWIQIWVIENWAIYVDQSFLLLMLLLLMCNCVVATTTTVYIKHMWLCNCVVATTTKLYIKHNKNKSKNINLPTFSVQL